MNNPFFDAPSIATFFSAVAGAIAVNAYFAYARGKSMSPTEQRLARLESKLTEMFQASDEKVRELNARYIKSPTPGLARVLDVEEGKWRTLQALIDSQKERV